MEAREKGGTGIGWKVVTLLGGINEYNAVGSMGALRVRVCACTNGRLHLQ